MRLGRRAPAIGLLVGGGIALLGCQQIAPKAPVSAPAASVPTPHSVEFQPIVQPGPQYMAAAQPAGQFEEPFVTPTPVPTIAPTPEPTVDEPAPEPPKLFQSGIASTYGEGDGFEGNRTACGQIFHTRQVQVAHKSLPCGTKVLVEDAASGKSVVAEVTDRGPYVPGRIVDLSWAAFSQLDAGSPGLLHVNVYLVDE